MTDEPKICRNCKHAKPWGILFFKDWDIAACHSPLLPQTINPVTGVKEPETKFCSSQRLTPIDVERCGPRAKWFEPK